MTCGVGPKRSSDPVLLWLRCRLATTALIRPLAWELPYAVGAALKKTEKKKKRKKRKKEKCPEEFLELPLNCKPVQWLFGN